MHYVMTGSIPAFYPLAATGPHSLTVTGAIVSPTLPNVPVGKVISLLRAPAVRDRVQLGASGGEPAAGMPALHPVAVSQDSELTALCSCFWFFFWSPSVA